MKRLMLLLSLGALALPALGQEPETLLSGSARQGFFGGPVVKFSEIDNDFAFFVGGRGGWIINFRSDHAFVIGGGGYGLTTDVKADGVTRSNRQQYLALGYGGLELEYVNRTSRLVHFSIQMLIGAGEVDYRNKGDNFDISDGDGFFVFEPGVNVLLNVADFMRLGGGVGYRFIDGVSREGVRDRDLRGVSGVMTLKFGSF